VGSTPEALATHLASESARWTKLIAARGIKIELKHTRWHATTLEGEIQVIDKIASSSPRR